MPAALWKLPAAVGTHDNNGQAVAAHNFLSMSMPPMPASPDQESPPEASDFDFPQAEIPIHRGAHYLIELSA